MTAEISKYITQQLIAASPAKLVYMLYDKAISSLNEAQLAIEEGDIERRWKANNRAVEIINHMWATLDIEKGGEIAENLSSLFGFMLRRLMEVDIKNDAAAAQEVIDLLTPLRDSWETLARSEAAESSATAQSAPAPKAAPSAAPSAAPGPEAPPPQGRTSISA